MMQVRFLTMACLPLWICCNEPAVEQTEQHQEPPIPEIYLKQGREISGIAQSELMSHVMASMAERGPAGTVSFCNERAMPLTDSLSRKFDCKIQRLSLKNRNPMNAPADGDEAIVLNQFLENHLEGKNLEPTVLRSGPSIVYYQPILLGMEGCLKCHGLPQKDIDNNTMAVLHELYPKDKATGYRLGDFRGAWKITFTD